jgi:heat shock protein HspQ
MSNSDFNPTPDQDPDQDPQEEPMNDPWSDLQADGKQFEVPDYFPDELPLFMPGTLVRHRRYGYRGVVVDFDMSCHADDTWYHANPSHPDRDQPWYHVLVHGSTINTYAAQENMIIDATGGQIDHHLVKHFFDGIDDLGYQRNAEPWPTFEE